MKHYHLDMALKRARSMNFFVQRNHNSNGTTEVVVAWGDWELVRRSVYTTGNARGQASFINDAIDRIMQVVNAKFHGVLYQSDRGYYFAVVHGVVHDVGFVWDRHLKLWQLSISSVRHIECEMKRIGNIKVRRTKIYWPEDLS